MKYCLNSRLSPIYLKKADQIKVRFNDFKSLPQMIEEYSDKEIILSIPNPLGPEETKELRRLNKIAKSLILSFWYFPTFEEREGFRFYTNYPVESFSEAKALINNGSEAIRIGSPLFFKIAEVAALQTQVRLVPNEPWLSVVPRDNGICGQWIRPEDLHYYDELLENAVVEFDNCRIAEEEALYRIYAEEHSFSGSIDYIIHNIGSEALNRLMPENLGPTRLHCGHRCQNSTPTCRVCPNAFKLATYVIDKY